MYYVFMCVLYIMLIIRCSIHKTSSFRMLCIVIRLICLFSACQAVLSQRKVVVVWPQRCTQTHLIWKSWTSATIIQVIQECSGYQLDFNIHNGDWKFSGIYNFWAASEFLIEPEGELLQIKSPWFSLWIKEPNKYHFAKCTIDLIGTRKKNALLV